MRGLAEIEGDPFKAEEAKRKLEREIGPLEEEIRGRKSGKSGGISSVFKKSTDGQNDSNSGMNASESYLFGNNQRGYSPPSIGEDNDLEYGEGSLTVPLTESERRMQDSEHLLRETQA